ncbi:hypothetical protein [Rhizobium sp. SL86]|uniref:hypothetical protein n=1 Tax=Rhizobium sp. SL86 TaxID=2995148 RepID=UPI0022757455|nr:hypothetical protein [Rhizobium sp. SL86]MCY1666952.1 hypothetical protein [Rhizobium sp. SL86]
MTFSKKRAAEAPPTGFVVRQGQSVTAWAMSPAKADYYPGEPALAEDRVAYRFINGFVDVGDLPCRIALWNEVKTRSVALQDFTVEALNLPGFNRRVEFSGFWHRPTRLSRWLKNRIIVPHDGEYRFRLATCGGVHIWVDGVLATAFEPFRRNKESLTEIALPLTARGSEVVVLCEELAERDALWYFELTLLSQENILVDLPVESSEETLDLLKELATSVRPAPLHVKDGRLKLQFEQAATVDVAVEGKVLASVHMRDKPPLLDAKAVLKAGERMLDLADVLHLPDGFHALDLIFRVSDVSIARHIGFATLREAKRDLHPLGLAARKRAALEFAAEHGEQRAGKAIACLEIGRPLDDCFHEVIGNTLASINERRDCSDFVMVPLLWVYGCYRDRLPEDLQQAIRTAILDYRYWVDEPGNDVMWFWSENHVLCFHVSQYLAGRLLPRAGFACSGRTGREQEQLATDRLMKWFDSVEAHGLAEWNSAAYYPIDFIGLLALEHLGDGQIRLRAKALLDRLFTMIALHTLGGVPAGSMGRAYDKELRAGPLTELAPFATVAFGEGWFNQGVAALPMFAASHYAPPETLDALTSPPAGEALTAHYVQGHDEAARLVLYKTANVQLSSMMDGKPGGRGHQQHVVDLRFAGDPFARAWVNHPGEDDPWGSQRPSYWAGNGSMPRAAQHENVALLLYDLGESPRIGFTHAYVEADAFDEVQLTDNWLILRSGKGFAALTATGHIEPISGGPGAGIEYRVAGTKCGWAVIVGEGVDEAAFARFRQSLAGYRLLLDADLPRLHLARPQGPELSLDWQDGLSVDDTPYSFPNRTLEPAIRSLDAVRF